MEPALDAIFNLTLAGITWGGGLIAFSATEAGARGSLSAKVVVGLLVFSLLAGAYLLSALIGHLSVISDAVVTIPPDIRVGGMVQWTSFIVSLILLTCRGFTRGTRGAAPPVATVTSPVPPLPPTIRRHFPWR